MPGSQGLHFLLVKSRTLLMAGSLEFVKDVQICSEVLRFLRSEMRVDIAAAHADLLDQSIGAVSLAIEACEDFVAVPPHHRIMASVAIVFFEYFLPGLCVAARKGIGRCDCCNAKQCKYENQFHDVLLIESVNERCATWLADANRKTWNKAGRE